MKLTDVKRKTCSKDYHTEGKSDMTIKCLGELPTEPANTKSPNNEYSERLADATNNIHDLQNTLNSSKKEKAQNFNNIGSSRTDITEETYRIECSTTNEVTNLQSSNTINLKDASKKQLEIEANADFEDTNEILEKDNNIEYVDIPKINTKECSAALDKDEITGQDICTSIDLSVESISINSKSTKSSFEKDNISFSNSDSDVKVTIANFRTLLLM